MFVGSDSEATGPEKDRPEVIIESEELMVEIDYVLLHIEDFEGSKFSNSRRMSSISTISSSESIMTSSLSFSGPVA